MKSHIIGFLLVTLAQIPMPIKIGTTFQNKLRPTIQCSCFPAGPRCSGQAQWQLFCMAGLERLGGGRGRGGATLACVGTAEWLYSVLYSALYMRVVHCTEAGPDQQLIMGDYFSDLPKVSPMSQPRELADPATSSWSAVRAGARPRAWSRDPGRGRAAKISFLQSAVSGGSWSGARVCHDDRPQPAAAAAFPVRVWGPGHTSH